MTSGDLDFAVDLVVEVYPVHGQGHVSPEGLIAFQVSAFDGFANSPFDLLLGRDADLFQKLTSFDVNRVLVHDILQLLRGSHSSVLDSLRMFTQAFHSYRHPNDRISRTEIVDKCASLTDRCPAVCGLVFDCICEGARY